MELNENQTKALTRISWSRIQLWRRSRADFHKRYILEEPFIPNEAMKYGQRIDDIICGTEMPETENERKIAEIIPKGFLSQVKFETTYEYKLQAHIKLEHKFHIIGFADLVYPNTKKIYDIKTTNSDATILGGLEQVRFYAFIDYLKEGKLNYTGGGVYAIKKGEDKIINGIVDTFEREWGMETIEKMGSVLKQFITEVIIHYNKK